MRVMVTGCAGFIGSNIVEELLKRNYSVIGIDNFDTGSKDNISGFLENKNYNFIEGDIRDLEFLNKTIKEYKPEYISHQAARPSVPRSIADPITTNDSNIAGTLNVLIAAKDANVKRVIYASSSSVYGDTPTLPKKEDMTPNPKSPYAITKLTGEYYCKVFYEIYGLETVSLRYFNVFGQRQDPNSQYAAVIPRFITSILEDKPPIVYGDGEQTRDFTYVKNVVEANMLALKAKDIGGEIFNIACGERITLNEIIKVLNEILGKNIAPHYTDPRPGDIKHSLADISKARRFLGYTGKYNFKEGLKETIKWYKNKWLQNERTIS